MRRHNSALHCLWSLTCALFTQMIYVATWGYRNRLAFIIFSAIFCRLEMYRIIWWFYVQYNIKHHLFIDVILALLRFMWDVSVDMHAAIQSLRNRNIWSTLRGLPSFYLQLGEKLLLFSVMMYLQWRKIAVVIYDALTFLRHVKENVFW